MDVGVVGQDDVPSLDEIGTAAEFVVYDDLSNGKELNKLRVINLENEDKISPFEYITNTEHSENLDLPCRDGPIFRPTARFQVFFKDCLMEWALQSLGDIDAGAPLFEYVGVLGRPKWMGTTADNDDYIVAFEHNGQEYQLDAFRKGNLARFVNHSCQSNCCAVLVTNSVPIAGTAGEKQQQVGQVPVVMIYARRRIFAGEEITMDYGERWWLSKACPCVCLSENCKYDDNGLANSEQMLTDLAADYGKQMAYKEAKRLQGPPQTAKKSAVPIRFPKSLSRIEVGPSIGQWSSTDIKLTADQLAELTNDGETDEQSD